MGALELIVEQQAAILKRLETIENHVVNIKEDEIMNLNDVANFLGFTQNTVRTMVRNGRLTPFRHSKGAHMRFKKSDVLKSI